MARRKNQDQEKEKCQEFVQRLNETQADRYLYMGLVKELRGEDFPDALIKDRVTNQELGVEITRFGLDWMALEQANMDLIAKRFGYELKEQGYEGVCIFLQTRDFTSHPLAKLSAATLADLARTMKRFLVERREWLFENINTAIFLDQYAKEYAPLVRVFQSLSISSIGPNDGRRVDDLSPVVTIGALGWENREMHQRAETAMIGKLRGKSYSTDILLIYGDGASVSNDVRSIVQVFQSTAAEHNASGAFKEIWYLSPYWDEGKRLYRIV